MQGRHGRSGFFFAIFAASLATSAAHAGSLRFFGTGSGDIDRVKIRIDPPGPPADVGGTDFTIEFWLKAAPGSNPAGAISCGANINWINGNIVFDRDRYDQNRAFGISLGAGRVAFGARTSSDRTICGTKDLRDGAWHHVAVQRQRSNGALSIYVDGVLEATGVTPNNEDISYPDNAVPTSNCGFDGNQPCTESDPFIVLGAEKHDAGAAYPSFNGWLDELRISRTLRYAAAFTPPQSPFTADAQTAALYHFDEGNGTALLDFATGGASPGVLRVGGNPSGPQWSADTPFGASPAAGTIQLGAATYTVAENAPSVSLGVTRVGGSAGAVTIDAATAAGTATADVDYVTTFATPLSWNDNDAAPKSFVVALNDDAVFEGDETFTVTLSNVTGGAVLGTRSSATVTLQENELPPAAGVLELAATAYSVGESAGSATVTLRRRSGTDGVVTLQYSTAPGTASVGVDYQAANGTLSWLNGDLADKSFAVTILGDAVDEADETVMVTVANATGGATLGAPVMAQITIVDDDAPAAAGGGSGGSGGSGGGGAIAWPDLCALLILGAAAARVRRLPVSRQSR